MKENSNKTLKILIGVIIFLSTVILISSVLYILNIQNKITKLETEQKEQLKKQIETQNMASIQSVQPAQPNEKVETQSQTNTTQTQKTNTDQNKNSNTQSSIKRGSVYATKSTSGPVNVRAEPTMNSVIIEKLPDDVVLKYLSSKGNWYYVVYNIRGYNEYGYIYKSQLAR